MMRRTTVKISRRLSRMARAVALATLGVAAPSLLESQRSCVAAVEPLVDASMLGVAQSLASPKEGPRLIADGVVCSSASTPFVTRTISVGPISARVALQRPQAAMTMLGGLPDPRMDGPMWAGRGASGMLSGGISADVWRLHATFSPVIWGTENRSFAHFPARDPQRNGFASPFYDGMFSADLPTRFGVGAFAVVDFGESAVWFDAGRVEVGVATSGQRWGPRSRTPLLLGPDAPGIPRAFVRTAMPVPTRAGRFSATAMSGVLTESRFFDSDHGNDQQGLWGIATEWNPDERGLFAFGLAGTLLTQTAFRGDAEGMIAISAEMHSPNDGSRVWAQLGSAHPGPTLRDFLTLPYRGVVYSVGVEHSTNIRAGKLVIGAETANLESPPDVRGATPRDVYTSVSIPQGWTNRGQLLGAGTGPGSQTQWLSLDWVTTRWTAGIFGERVRWNEDAFLREYLPYFNRHDVSLRMGARGGVRFAGYEIGLELSTGKRLNFLFQNGEFIPGFPTVDIAIPQLRLAIVPVSARRSAPQQLRE